MNSNQTDIKRVRKTGIIAAFILFIIGCLHLYKGEAGFYLFPFILAAILLVMAGFFTRALVKVTQAVAQFITAIILSIIFYLVITPIGLMMRLFKRDLLEQSIEKDKLSYWVRKEPPSQEISGYEKQF